MAWAAAPAPVAHDGVIDLGAANADHVLRGDWRFAWQQFVDPASATPLPAMAPVPAAWNDLAADGKQPGADGFASYSLDVRCPAGKQLALSVPAQRTAMRLYVNGQLAASQGEPGRSAAQARPAIARRAVLTDPFACPLHIVVHLSNWSHRSGGFIRAPVAGPMEDLAPDHGQRLALDTILLGAYLVLGILPVFFFFARREQVALLFGLFCLAQTVYADMTGERLLLQLVSAETPWEVYLRIEYLSWFVSVVLFVLLVDQLFPRTLHPRAVRGFVIANIVPMLVIAVTPARVYSYLIFYGQPVGVLLGIYVTVSIARAARHGRTDAGVILVGMAFLLLVVATNLLQFYGSHMTQGGITAIGLLAFVLSPGIVLLRRLARLLNAEELRSAEEREKVDLLVRATQAGILDWQESHNLTRYSPRLLEILGWPSDADTSEWPPIFERIHPADRALVQEIFLNQLRDRSVKGGEMRHQPLEYRLLRRDGSFVWVHAEAISLRAPDGRTLRYICSYHDITDHRAVAEGLKRQNAALAENARLREDVERMSRHDLKTPLNSIIGVARLLGEDAAVPPEQRELLRIAERAGYRLLEMVNLSLDLSRMELGTYDFRPQAVNLLDVLARVLPDLQGLAQSCRVSVRMERSFDAPVYARAEELLCYSILANLLKNAIEATPAGGVVTIGIDAGDPLHLRIHNPGRVPAAVAGRFFDKYVTAGKANGTGLGTYSARLMARVQEGELEMRTGESGTVLALTLRALGQEALPPPPDATHPSEPSHRAAVTAADFSPCRVLVVDDDEYNRLLLLRYLPTPPFTVEAAGNGQAATEAMGRHWPDIVLVDMEMPVMGGLETVAWIRAHEEREQRQPCLVVMMSSNDDPESIRRGLLAGSNRYLAKPFTRETLLATLHDLLSGGAAVPMQVPLDLDGPQQRPRHAPVPSDAAVRVDPELLPEVPAFLESRRGMVEGMAAALADDDRLQLRTVAHRAAGGLALFGFHWAAWQARRISSRAADADAAELHGDIDTLRAHLRSVQVR